jgi:tRNA pseudouridine55 synthase
VANKPIFVSSNKFLGSLKRKYNTKKAGYSGTLDPFAKGSLVVAFGKYTKLFKYLKKTPKKYRATIWMGVQSDSLDIENVISIENAEPLDAKIVEDNIKKLIGEISYIPPKFCAKKIDGKRAYTLARDGKEVILKEQSMTIYDVKLVLYSHPFITFECSVSEGAYIRSLAQILLKLINRTGTLSYLERLSEGTLYYEEEKGLSPMAYLNIGENFLLDDTKDIENGEKISLVELKIQKAGEYYIRFKQFFSIISVKSGKVSYLVNRIYVC